MITAFHGDCFDVLPQIPDASVDLILTDPPYGITQQPYDIPLDMFAMWDQFNRIITPNGAMIIFAMQPFVTDVITANRKLFRYELIYEKTHAQGFMNAKKMPLKAHENVLVFYKKQPYYNPQMEEGKPYRVDYKRNYDQSNYGKKECGRKGKSLVNTGTRYPRSLRRVSNPNMKMFHPHGKPVVYLEYLIRMYSQPGAVILDATAGGFSTPLAVLNVGEDRKCIAIEKDDAWFDKGVLRLLEERNYTPSIVHV